MPVAPAAFLGRIMSVEVQDVGGVLIATVDDGRANALTFEVIAGIRSAVKTARDRSQPLVINGREGYFCAGFDLEVINGGDEGAILSLLNNGAGLVREIVEAPIPVVASCTGHALAGGALLLLSTDYRVGTSGSFKLGLNEVRIGMALPSFGVAVAVHRLDARYLTAATMFAEVGSPERALEMGYLDEVVADSLETALLLARSLTSLPMQSFATTKRGVRRALQVELAALSDLTANDLAQP